MPAKEYKKIVLNRLKTELEKHGFKISGNNFQSSNNDLAYYIRFQSSKSSTATSLKLTINIEIASLPLYKIEDTSVPEKDRRHYTQRIGFFTDQPTDKWWTVESTNDAHIAAEEIVSMLNGKVLPTLNSLKSTGDLVSLWRQGKCPGLTETKRKEYLSLLEELFPPD